MTQVKPIFFNESAKCTNLARAQQAKAGTWL